MWGGGGYTQHTGPVCGALTLAKEDRERGGVNLLASQLRESDKVELFSFSMRTVVS